MTQLDANTRTRLLEGLEALFHHRLDRLEVDQTELWLGVEPNECRCILEHFNHKRPERLEVYGSSHPDALSRRNRTGGGHRTLLVILDERWEPRAQDFGQSLQEGARKQVSQLLAEPVEFPIEREWLDRAKDDPEASAWITNFLAVIRGRDRRNYVSDRGQAMKLRLGTYFNFLTATLPEAPHGQPHLALARGIHRLGLFTHPALTEMRPPKSAEDRAFRERLVFALSQNYRAARDADGFSEQLASRQRSAEQVLEEYSKDGRLSSDPAREDAARVAFRLFLRNERVDEALRTVDWDFRYRAETESASARRGGRRRRGGVSGLLSARDAQSERKLNLVEQFVGRASEDKKDQVRQEVEKLIDDLSRVATTDLALQELKTRAIEAWKDAPNTRELDKLTGALETISRKARREADTIEASTLTEGLVEFALWVRRTAGDKPPTQEWTVGYPTGVEQKLRPTDDGWRQEAHRALRACEQDSGDDYDAENPDDGFIVPLELRAGSIKRTLYLREPPEWRDAGFRQKISRPRLEQPASTKGPIDLPLAIAKQTRVQALLPLAETVEKLAELLDPAGPFAVAHVRDYVARYEDLLGTALTGRRDALTAELEPLKARKRELRKSDPRHPDLPGLDDRIEQIEDELEGLGDEQLWDIRDLEELARFQTLLPDAVTAPEKVRDGPEQAWLMPLHPLVLRARAVVEEVALGAVADLMNPQKVYTDRQLRFLEEALDDLGTMEPCRWLSPWHEAGTWPPLAFQQYNRRFAQFVRAAEASPAHGRHELLRALRDYLELYPTARDRLVLYFEADERGKLAYQVARSLVFGGEDGEVPVEGVDLRLAGDADGQFEELAEAAANRAGPDESLFGVTRGRLRPRVLFRADEIITNVDPERAAHAAIVFAGRPRPGHAPLLATRVLPHPQQELPGSDPFALTSLLRPLPPQQHDTQLKVFTARDRLDLRWEELQLRVHNRRDSMQFVTEVNLAMEQNGNALAALHANADWVMLLSRLPVHRAIEKFQGGVVRLIDRKRFLDRGHDYFLTISTSNSQAIEEMLAVELQKALGARPSSLAPLLGFVQRFAPGLAMRFVGRERVLGPEGVLGLLLTAMEGEQEPGAVCIPLDEHPWLFGRTGLRADVLSVVPVDGGLRLRVLESKYNAKLSEDVVRKAQQQVDRTATAIRDWTTLEVVSPYFRRRLHDALLAHGSTDEEAYASRQRIADRLIGGAPVCVDDASAAHVWLWHEPASKQSSNLIIHQPEDTRAKLGKLVKGE